jgi:hypothetical protein
MSQLGVLAIVGTVRELLGACSMPRIARWVKTSNESVGANQLRHMVATTSSSEFGSNWTATVIPRQYASARRIASILSGLGKPSSAKYLETKLPTGKKARSGDLGEILATQYASRELGYRMICRLRWKDHPEMAMRGDDFLGVRILRDGTIEFLKGESKSRARLNARAVKEADDALQRDDGRPSPHALAFVVDRQFENGNDDLALLIDRAQLLQGIKEQQVVQLLFTLTGNNPSTFLRANTNDYLGRIRRLAVGLEIPQHKEFINSVYTKAVAIARSG